MALSVLEWALIVPISIISALSAIVMQFVWRKPFVETTLVIAHFLYSVLVKIAHTFIRAFYKIKGLFIIVVLLIVSCSPKITRDTDVKEYSTTTVDSVDVSYSNIKEALDSISVKLYKNQKELLETVNKDISTTILERDTAGRVLKEVYEITTFKSDTKVIDNAMLLEQVTLIREVNEDLITSVQSLKETVSILQDKSKDKKVNNEFRPLRMIVLVFIVVFLMLLVATIRIRL